MKIAGLIPARMASSRFPGKPIALIAGRPMIEHVYRRVAMNPRFDTIAIATCDEEIARVSEGFGCRAIMTSAAHQRGTDRVAEAALGLDVDVVVNIQGDEPLIAPEIFDDLLAPFDADPDLGCTNLMNRLTTDEEQDSLNNVKAAVDRRGFAMYFSREPIPSRRMGARPPDVFRQIGIYAFKKPLMKVFSELPPTPCEVSESCDMMRLIEHGYRIRMVETTVVLQSVDTPADLAAAERLMRSDPLFPRYADEPRAAR
jgi:3-deoxy-manno-octulosonate cytidylyltransferase (CMP-KDO synthetase)